MFSHKPFLPFPHSPGLTERLLALDRRSVPAGVMDGVRALLNIGVDIDDYAEDEGDTDTHAYPGRIATPGAEAPRGQDYAGHDGEGTVGSVDDTVDGNRTTHDDGNPVPTHNRSRDNGNDGSNNDYSGVRSTNGMILGGSTKTQSHASTTDEDDTDQEDGDDPWGDGRGESRWGQRIGVTTGRSGTGDGGAGLALAQALGSWCASVSAYDRLAYLAPGSAAQRAAEAETEWDELERRIARSSLDLQLEEFR